MRAALFSYRCHTSFGRSTEAASHLVRVTCFLDLDARVRGFRFHFDDREPVPVNTQWISGKIITYLADGPGGERIEGLEVSWSDKNEVAGLDVEPPSLHSLQATDNIVALDESKTCKLYDGLRFRPRSAG